MEVSKDMGSSVRRPKNNLRLYYALSFVIAALTTIVTALGLLFQGTTYPSEALRKSFIPTDVVILFIGLPILLGSMWSARRGRLLGMLSWPGALFFVTYHYLIYIFAMPVGWVFLLELLLAPLSTFTLCGLLTTFDTQSVKKQLAGRVPERLAGGALASLGMFIVLRTCGVIIKAQVNQSTIPRCDLATMVSDVFISFAWVAGGVMLWRKKAFGYVSAIGLLFQSTMMFIALLAVFVLQSILSDVPFPAVDAVVIFVMGCIVFVPFGFFIRGVLLSKHH